MQLEHVQLSKLGSHNQRMNRHRPTRDCQLRAGPIYGTSHQANSRAGRQLGKRPERRGRRRTDSRVAEQKVRRRMAGKAGAGSSSKCPYKSLVLSSINSSSCSCDSRVRQRSDGSAAPRLVLCSVLQRWRVRGGGWVGDAPSSKRGTPVLRFSAHPSLGSSNSSNPPPHSQAG